MRPEHAFGEIEKAVRRTKHDCLYPSCAAKAVQCHSQQKQGQLRAIADSSMVMALDRNHYRLRRSRQPFASPLREIGISEATTFDGFCNHHDKQLFAPIEQKNLEFGDTSQIAPLFLRAMVHEICMKREAEHRLRLILDPKYHLIENEDQYKEVEDYRTGVKLYLQREAPYYLKHGIASIEGGEQTMHRFIWWRIPRNIGASCTTSINPLLDEYGRDVNYLTRQEAQPLVAFSVVPSVKNTDVIACWLTSSEPEAGRLMNKLLEPSKFEKWLTPLLFAESEDTCIKPSLWKSLTDGDRAKISKAISTSHRRGPVRDVPKIFQLDTTEIRRIENLG